MTPAWRTVSAVVMTVAIATVTACSNTKELPSPAASQGVVRQTGTLGTPVDDFGVSVAVLRIDPSSQSPGGFPRILVTIRSESRRSAPWQNPDVALRCAGSKAEGDWFDSSTWEASGILVAGQIAEGQLLLGFPAKSGSKLYPVATCPHATVVVTGTDPANRQRQLVTSYPVPDATIRTSIDAERGQS